MLLGAYNTAARSFNDLGRMGFLLASSGEYGGPAGDLLFPTFDVPADMRRSAAVGEVGVLAGSSFLGVPERLAAKGAGTGLKDFNLARNAALEWLEARGFKAEQATLGKFGDNAGKPIGMKTADGIVGFRVEYDVRSGAHINVWSGKEKGPHFTFEGSQSTVDQIVKQFVK